MHVLIFFLWQLIYDLAKYFGNMFRARRAKALQAKRSMSHEMRLLPRPIQNIPRGPSGSISFLPFGFGLPANPGMLRLGGGACDAASLAMDRETAGSF